MSPRTNEREWIDADEWRQWRNRYQKLLGREVDLSEPLNFRDAALLADMGSFEYEHQSDGTTLIKVGAQLVEAVRAY